MGRSKRRATGLQRTVDVVLERVVIAAPPVAQEALMHEFPSILFAFARDENEAALRSSEWTNDAFDTWEFDVRVDAMASAPFALHLIDDARDPDFVLQVMNRCQRHVRRRNRDSRGELFARILRAHRTLHEIEKPLVRADYNHALDVWQWVLRLDPDASAAVQIAALFHDVERLVSEADARIEHLAGDYQAFKNAHARKGALLTSRTLEIESVPANTIARVTELITAHEERSEDPEVALLNDADALSFFGLNSHGYAAYFGPDQTEKKVAYTWNRMRPAARARVSTLLLPRMVREQVCQFFS